MTILCGMAHNYVQLLLARIGVGVGEAGCTPAAHSLITDTVEPSKRSSAIDFYGLGIPIGTLLGLVIGGFVNDLWGWRGAFLLVGMPGSLMAVIKIGRASCRDRRWQAVWVPVVAVLYKKKR